MEKRLDVIVVAVPIVPKSTREWRERVAFKINKRTPRIPKGELEESFTQGAANWVKKPVVKALASEGCLGPMGFESEVVDAGELLLDSGEGKGIDLHELAGLAREFSETAKDFDLAIVLGGDHTGGLVLYGLPGKVARYDEHTDSCEIPATCVPDPVRRNNYVCGALNCGFKEASDIVGVGMREGAATFKRSDHANGADIVDIDVDVISQKYGIKSEYSRGTLSPDDLVGAVRTNRPKALGIFELVDGDPKGLSLAVQLCTEAARAAARRKLHKRD